jgi:ABC-type dipeptide/oligopeptide/nickel transport system permease subunit
VAAGIVALGLGLLAGYAGGAVDHVIMRALDVFFAFPLVLLAYPKLFAGIVALLCYARMAKTKYLDQKPSTG